ncbi:protein NYNRIN-like [Cucumis melo var. makuwa]|uniref:Protein NYNRIN-like n=1 Tax=Cucumis melo var. makuwa TaxID=1194695 RepID=A0A5D3BQM9_CUCMM|nr:protein NYNRIN-like [Cucumis melo var. makuwa]
MNSEDEVDVAGCCHVTIEETFDHDTFEEDVEVVPLSLEDGGQSMIDELKEVNLGTIEEPRPTFISIQLSDDDENEYVNLLKGYKNVFAWSYKEMSGIDPKVVVHRLAIKPEHRSVKQAQRRFRPKLISQIEEEKYLLNLPILSAPAIGKPLILYIVAQETSLGTLLAQENDKVRGQALTDFLSDHSVPSNWKLCDDLPDEEVLFVESMEPWTMFFDVAVRKSGAGVGIVFISPEKHMLSYSFILRKEESTKARRSTFRYLWCSPVWSKAPTSVEKNGLLLTHHDPQLNAFREAEVVPLREAKKENIVNFVWTHIIYRYGIPHRIVTNNGRQFTNTLMDKLCEKFNFKQYNSSIYNTAVNGLAEAFNKTLCNLLKNVVSKTKGDCTSTRKRNFILKNVNSRTANYGRQC